jgi:hypothetical protein
MRALASWVFSSAPYRLLTMNTGNSVNTLSRLNDLSYYGYMLSRDEVRYEIKFRQCRISVARPSAGE